MSWLVSLSQRAASLGCSACLTRLAYMFDVGIGVEVDKSRAMHLYKSAWRQGNELAANNIAILYRERGQHRLMFQWFLRAEKAGDEDALVELAKCYLNGVGVRKSDQHALRCLASAVSSDCITEASREEAEALLEGLRPRTV
ncbi:MAG: tetratricopeptide repeat protein [Sphingomicrobium sp.]